MELSGVFLWLVMFALLLCAFLAFRVAAVERRLELFERLLDVARKEARAANGQAISTQRILSSVLSGADARRAVRGKGGVQDSEHQDIELEALRQRMEYRRAMNPPGPLDLAGEPINLGEAIEEENGETKDTTGSAQGEGRTAAFLDRQPDSIL